MSIIPENTQPLEVARYIIGRCSGLKTITLANLLFRNHGVRCWVPKLRRANPTKKQKRVIAALPGFVFIDSSQFEEALQFATQRQVPEFSPLLVNGDRAHVTNRELLELEYCVTRINLDAQEIGSMRVGDDVRVVKGPLSGGLAVLLEIYIDLIPMARIEMVHVEKRNGAPQVFSIPLLLIRSA